MLRQGFNHTRIMKFQKVPKIDRLIHINSLSVKKQTNKQTNPKTINQHLKM